MRCVFRNFNNFHASSFQSCSIFSSSQIPSVIVFKKIEYLGVKKTNQRDELEMSALIDMGGDVAFDEDLQDPQNARSPGPRSHLRSGTIQFLH
jgi:hypothetical protein